MAVDVRFDLSAPRLLLDMSDAGAVDDDALEAWVNLPANVLLVEQMPREFVVRNAREVVDGTASGYGQPLGRPGTLRMEPRQTWAAQLAWLEGQTPALEARVEAFLERFDAGLGDSLVVDVAFHLGGGWDARSGDRIYVNLTRLMDVEHPVLAGVEALVAGEALQWLLAAAHPDFVHFQDADRALLTFMTAAVTTGVSRFAERQLLQSAYPTGSFAAGKVESYALADRGLGESLAFADRYVALSTAGRFEDAEAALVDGVRAGHVEAIGEFICRNVVAAAGDSAVVDVMRQGAAQLFRRYSALAAEASYLPPLPAVLAERAPKIAAALEPAWRQAVAGRQAVFAAFAANDYAAAEAPLRSVIEAWPGDPVDAYNFACIHAVGGRTHEALEALSQAVELGFADAAHMLADPDLESLRDLPEFLALVESLDADSAAR